jgi:hypothetical protein
MLLITLIPIPQVGTSDSFTRSSNSDCFLQFNSSKILSNLNSLNQFQTVVSEVRSSLSRDVKN